jgi:hypothetical protein
MGFFSKLFGSVVRCQACGKEGQDSFGGVQCRNDNCRNFVGHQAAPRSYGGGSGIRRPYRGQTMTKGPFAESVEIRYSNHQDEVKTFTADATSARDKGAFVSVVVQPDGARISLRKENILNPDALARLTSAIESGPSGKELYILWYHKAHGTTSALFESIASKYPELAALDAAKLGPR